MWRENADWLWKKIKHTLNFCVGPKKVFNERKVGLMLFLILNNKCLIKTLKC